MLLSSLSFSLMNLKGQPPFQLPTTFILNLGPILAYITKRLLSPTICRSANAPSKVKSHFMQLMICLFVDLVQASAKSLKTIETNNKFISADEGPIINNTINKTLIFVYFVEVQDSHFLFHGRHWKYFDGFVLHDVWHFAQVLQHCHILGKWTSGLF